MRDNACVDGISQDTAFLEVLNLVLHQGNEGSYHDADALLGKGRNLEGDRFTTTCRHKTEGILTSGYTLDDVSSVCRESQDTPSMFVVSLEIYLPFVNHVGLMGHKSGVKPSSYTSSFVWTDIFYLKLNLVLLEDILFYGVGYVETSLALDVAGSCTLSEGNAV